MGYTVKFDFNCMNKRSMISGKSGEVDITTESLPEQLMKSEELTGLISAEMERKTGKLIISVEITDIQKK